MYVIALHACLVSTEGRRGHLDPPWTGVTAIWVLGIKPIEEQSVLLTDESSFQPRIFLKESHPLFKN